MTDDLSGYFERMPPKATIKVCADCEARPGERHREIEHPITNEQFVPFFSYANAVGHRPSPREWANAVYHTGLEFLAHKEIEEWTT